MDLDKLLAEVDAADMALAESVARRWKAALALSAGLEASDAGDEFNPAKDAARIRAAVDTASKAGAPADTIARIWRTLIGDGLTASRVSDVIVAGGDFEDLSAGARGYFGFSARLTPMASPREALDRVSEARGAVACMPWPEQAGQGQWWPMLNENRFSDLRIVSGWPMLPSAPDTTPEIAIVAKLPLDSSGSDDMFATAHDDHYEAERTLKRVGLEARVVARVRSLALIRIQSFVAETDVRLAEARSSGLDGLRVVGACPRP